MSMNHGCLLIFGKLGKIGTGYILQYLRSQQVNDGRNHKTNSNKIRIKNREIKGLDCKPS